MLLGRQTAKKNGSIFSDCSSLIAPLKLQNNLESILTDCCFLSGASRNEKGERPREGEEIARRCMAE